MIANKVSTPPKIAAIDIKNMFPSVFLNLALPAITERLLNHGFGEAESPAVLAALELVWDGTRVKWRDDVIRQINGCSLGPADSCDYADIALDGFLKVLVPRLESSLGLDLTWLRFFRDDGFLVFFGEASVVLDILWKDVFTPYLNTCLHHV